MSNSRASVASRPSSVPRPAPRARLVSLKSVDLEEDESPRSVPPPLPKRDVASSAPPSRSAPPSAATSAPVSAIVPRDPRPLEALEPVVVPAPAPVPALEPVRASAVVPAPVPTPRTRLAGDELVTAMFDRVHALHFVADALEAASYCLTVIADLIPCKAILVHFFDATRRDFIVVAARGICGDDLVLERHPASDPVLEVGISRGRAAMVNDVEPSVGTSVARFATLGGVHRVLVAPVMQADRCLGAIELIDPSDEHAFDAADGNSVGYVADRFADYISSHGVIVDVSAVARFAFGSQKPDAPEGSQQE